jgi:hypothetical protein
MLLLKFEFKSYSEIKIWTWLRNFFCFLSLNSCPKAKEANQNNGLCPICEAAGTKKWVDKETGFIAHYRLKHRDMYEKMNKKK